jgi:hypothetical protein
MDEYTQPLVPGAPPQRILKPSDLTKIRMIIEGVTASIAVALQTYYGVSTEGRSRAECFDDLIKRYMKDMDYHAL